MATKAEVSSKSLIELQNELNALSRTLQDLYETLNSDINRLADSWMDQKFEEFGNEFRSRQEAIAELADKYNNWANKYLPPIIEQVLKGEGVGVTIG